ncbi:heme peroxidase 2-like [Uranotaenia lowii]|uniref:heme peroxidase 2-like n=1 Tax=Uranotaenia lowii TaxID=190385 RepID=UPI00247A52C5|nr:heme peroxidase 2-like [Uranotaenia lowii]
MEVSADDRYYGQRNVRCLNFSPLENFNDRCQLKYTTKRNSFSTYLDLSQIYGIGEYESDGKLKTGTCEAAAYTENFGTISAQFLSITGLFTKFHNYCVDQVSSCGTDNIGEDVREKCRSVTIGIYQRIIYEEVLVTLFGSKFYSECDLDCNYDKNLRSAIGSSFVYALGRFQHMWLPENLTYFSESTPTYNFFQNRESFDCSGTLEGMLVDTVRPWGISDIMMHSFLSTDGENGICLMCVDLERGRSAGLCPLLSFLHYQNKITGRKNVPKCYNNFEDLDDMFNQELIDTLKKHYESPMDLDLLFAIFEKNKPQGSLLPKTVAISTCQTFKRLKCSDRFFYRWNPFHSSAIQELITIVDMSILVALFGNVEKVPVNPFTTRSRMISASVLRSYLENHQNLFCEL